MCETRRLLSFRLNPDVWNKAISFFLASSSRLQSRCVKQGDLEPDVWNRTDDLTRLIQMWEKQEDFFLANLPRSRCVKQDFFSSCFFCLCMVFYGVLYLKLFKVYHFQHFSRQQFSELWIIKRWLTVHFLDCFNEYLSPKKGLKFFPLKLVLFTHGFLLK